MGMYETADDLLRRSANDPFSDAADLYVALSLARLFWPETRRLNGAVFLTLAEGDAAEIERRVAAWKGAGEMRWSHFVDSFNTFEVRYLFSRWPTDSEVMGESESCLARFLCDAWSAKLGSDFPDRRFSVELEDEGGSDGPRVSLRQTHPPLVWEPER